MAILRNENTKCDLGQGCILGGGGRDIHPLAESFPPPAGDCVQSCEYF